MYTVVFRTKCPSVKLNFTNEMPTCRMTTPNFPDSGFIQILGDCRTPNTPPPPSLRP